jgi:hypothetical protein
VILDKTFKLAAVLYAPEGPLRGGKHVRLVLEEGMRPSPFHRHSSPCTIHKLTVTHRTKTCR